MSRLPFPFVMFNQIDFNPDSAMGTVTRNQRFLRRQGITLLFVISMVVLFLLMGTSFMLVSNDYYKAARRRAVTTTNVRDSESILDRCFYELVRGPSLFDNSSPLRGHSILADQYGYCLLYTSPSPRDGLLSRMPSSA